jgi:phosphatidylinositol glycan class F
MASKEPEQKSHQAQPISILDSAPARLYAHVHPLLILSGYVLQFKSIVANPTSSLTALLFPLAALQTLYLILCLPPAGSSSATIKPVPNKQNANSRKKISGQYEGGIPKRISVSLTLELLA